ncbi:DUF1919 domain-containing protein [Thomasclavelia spiroformis]|uniref:DUF1919 domain-containing protein n=1 Tax=Thomasclavelia spiroformis TaxID=29348 RepID=UPI002676C51E|nr:DUF1919 domain-containing protein [Thomasclavelia spiroformis]
MEINSRTENSILNINFSIISQLIKIIFSFLSRTIFIYVLGKKFLGINGVYASILSYLALSELGIGTAVTFTLYKPIADNDKEKIKSIVRFYRNIYKFIGFFIICVGLSILPFLQNIISDFILTRDLYIAYIIYVLNIASSYLLFSYRQVLLIASQKKHKIEKTNIICYFVTNCLQIIFLLIFEDYILYLLIQFVTQNVQQYWIYKIVGNEYPYIKGLNAKPLSITDKRNIKHSVFSIAMFKMGAVILNSTDNIIISAFIGVSVVAIYSNYHLLISTVTGLIGLIFSSLTASVGNLNVSADSKKREDIFNKIFFVSTLLYGVGGMILYQMLNPFISLWLGKSYVFSNTVVLIFVVDFILAGYMIPIDTFKDACGVFKVGRYRPLLTIVINLLFSIFLARKVGIAGVVFATTVSRILTTFWIDSKYTFEIVFEKKPYTYYITFWKYMLYNFIGIGILSFVRQGVTYLSLTPVTYFFITLLYTGVFICIYIRIIYGKKSEFIELKDLAIKIVKNKMLRKNLYNAKKKLKRLYNSTIEKMLCWIRRTFILKNKNFTIISNNCWGGRIYQRYGLRYSSPTIGLLLFADDYIKFVSNLRYYISLDLKFIPKIESRYYEYYTDKDKYYPIGVLDDIEIVFLHYKSESEAKEKWDRRKARINWNNLIIKFNDQNRATEKHIRDFDKLPYKNKLCFVAHQVNGTKCTIHFKEFENDKFVKNDIISYKKYINIDKYLNEHKD